MEHGKKVAGYDHYEIEAGARTLIEAQEIKKKPKFYAAVKKELVKQAKAANAAALEAKVGKKLKETFGSSHSSHKKGGY